MEPAATAQGSIEETELELLLDGIHRVFGYDLRQYARSTVKRRLLEIVHDDLRFKTAGEQSRPQSCEKRRIQIRAD